LVITLLLPAPACNSIVPMCKSMLPSAGAVTVTGDSSTINAFFFKYKAAIPFFHEE
jgi:hypothetical protein